MSEGIVPVKTGKPQPQSSRTFWLTVLCIFSFVYFGLLTGFFAAGLFNASLVAEVINMYSPVVLYTPGQVRMITLILFLLHLLAFTGTILIWKQRRKGYYFLGAACLAIALIHLFSPQIALTTTLTYLILVFLFGFFFRRLN